MSNYQVEFDAPWYLLLLLLVPLLWIFSYRSLAGLGRWRRLVALLLRTGILVCLVGALAEINWVRRSDRLTVIYLLDQSLSIPAPQRASMIEFVNAAIDRHRKNDDRAGVIVFGRDAAIEIPPFDDNVQMPPALESQFDPQFTNLASAMRLAQASFPEDAAKRIVVVSDGNQNLEDAVEQARGLIDAGISIDVRPIRYQSRAEVSIEKVTVPSEVRKGEPFDVRVVVDNSAVPTAEDPGQVKGRIIVSQQSGDQPVVLSDEEVELEPGKRVFTLRQEIDEAAGYTYEARFVPDQAADDGIPQNNRATAFTHIRGSGQVLLIEDVESRGEFDLLAQRLRAENLDVTLRPSDQLFSGLGELQQYDTVLLGNVPREAFSDTQIKALVRNTEQMGAGLVMLGGPNSFGAGGWTNSDLEKAMPVDFQIRSAEVSPKGALALIMHASEMAQGNYWQKVISQEAIKTLGSQDYCGVLHWDGTDQWLWGQPLGLIRVGDNRDQMLARVDRMVPGDMPDFDPSLLMAVRSFRQIDAAVKHTVIISDGDPAPPSGGVMSNFVKEKITVSTVAVGTHGPAGSQVLQRLATQTGGKYYEVRNPKALPRIFQREARRVAAPLIYEQPPPFSPQVTTDHEMTRGLPETLPPITGFVLTTLKRNPLVEVSLRAPRPANEENRTILASWTYGLGRTVAFTTDCGARWASDWTSWEGYDKLMSQIVRWSMRPTGDQGKFSLATDVRDGQVHVTITALDQEDQYLNFLKPTATVVGPDMEPRDLKIEQVAPGRYVGTFAADDAGSYLMLVNPGAQMAPLRSGVNVPYSAEFRTRTPDTALLEQLVAMAPRGAQPGRFIDPPQTDLDSLLATNSFRHDLLATVSSLPAWHLALWFAGCLFFFDIFVRRVAISFAWVGPLAGRVRDRVLGRPSERAGPQYLERLQTKKAAVAQEIDQRKAAVQFEPEPSAASADALAEELDRGSTAASAPSKPAPTAPAPATEDEDYTSRLLKAKKRVWTDKQPPTSSEPPPPSEPTR